MSCINRCGKPCCDQPPRNFFLKCVGPCKRRLMKVETCSDRNNCGHVTGSYTFIYGTVQFCLGTKLPCLYVCQTCIHKLRSVGCGTSEVTRNNVEAHPTEFVNGYNPLRLWKVGTRFEYLCFVFYVDQFASTRPYSFTLRKELS
jgi:hypothetical protein